MVTATNIPAGGPLSGVKMVAGGAEAAEMVRLRVSQGGKFVQTEQAVWKYVGGDTFMHTVPVAWRYAELMFSLAEKVDGAVSVKYQLPGEELDPDSLISVSDDSDLQELFDEYARALRLPGTPVKTFRLRIFLFRAAEDPLTPEDIAAADKYLSSRASSADKFAKESGLSKAFSKAATNSYASNYSSGSSSANMTSQGGGGGPPGETDTELAWEAGFRAGQEAMAMAAAEAAEEEWQQLVERRMVSLAKVQSHLMLGDADAAAWGPEGDYSCWAMQHAAAAAAAAQRSGSLYSRASYHAAAASGRGGSSAHQAQQALAGRGSAGLDSSTAGLPEDLLGDFPVDMEEGSQAELADLAGANAPVAALTGLLGGHPVHSTAPPSPQRPLGGVVTSLPGSRIASPRLHPLPLALSSPRQPLSSPRRPLAPLPDHPSLFSPLSPRQAAATAVASPRPSPLHPQPQPGDLEEQASVHMTDVPSAEFENMFESKYSAAPLLAEGSAGLVGGRGSSGAGGGMAHAGEAKGRGSPNSLLPTHISAFGDGVDLAQAAAAVSPVAACLPTHISEFGEDDADGPPLERDPNAMSVMKAALPEEDLMLVASPAPTGLAAAAGGAGVGSARHALAAAAAAAAKLPPGSLQLPTTFELLAGSGGGAHPVLPPPSISPKLPLPQDMALVEDALPQQPSNLHRSPSVEELLRKVQCVDARQVRVLAKIGEGAFGEVSLAECPTYGRVAVKWIKPTKVERHWASFWHEAELMSRLNHPNVLRFYGLVVKGPLVVGIMTECAKNGSLAAYLRSGIGFVPLRLRAELALHAVHGMAYLHDQKVVHFDVKPDNLLVDGDFYSGCPTVKVADFGLSKHKYNTFCSNVHDLRGTLPYMAPEMIMDHQHVTEKADVWSLGVVFWEMLTLEVPYQDMPPAQLIGALGLGKLRLPIPDWCEPEWRALMESCWVVDPILRPSCRQLAVQLERIRDLAPL